MASTSWYGIFIGNSCIYVSIFNILMKIILKRYAGTIRYQIDSYTFSPIVILDYTFSFGIYVNFFTDNKPKARTLFIVIAFLL